MEIPASQGGVVKEVKVKLGDKVKQGSLVLLLEAEGAVDSPQTSEQKPAAAPVALIESAILTQVAGCLYRPERQRQREADTQAAIRAKLKARNAA